MNGSEQGGLECEGRVFCVRPLMRAGPGAAARQAGGRPRAQRFGPPCFFLPLPPDGLRAAFPPASSAFSVRRLRCLTCSRLRASFVS